MTALTGPTVRQPREEKTRDFRRKAWRRKSEDQVSPETHAFVMLRDGRCFLDRMHGAAHCCRDRWGVGHFPNELEKLTLDHVHLDGATMGKRAPSDAGHLVAMCWAGNVKPPSHAEREAERAYLAELAALEERVRHEFEEDARDRTEQTPGYRDAMVDAGRGGLLR